MQRIVLILPPFQDFARCLCDAVGVLDQHNFLFDANERESVAMCRAEIKAIVDKFH